MITSSVCTTRHLQAGKLISGQRKNVEDVQEKVDNIEVKFNRGDDVVINTHVAHDGICVVYNEARKQYCTHDCKSLRPGHYGLPLSAGGTFV